MKKLLMMLMMLVPTMGMWAQRSVKGVVKDTAGVALPYCAIFVEELQRGTLTDKNGEFLIDGVASGEYTVKASCVSFATKETKVNVQDRDLFLAFQLEEEAITMAEVIILPPGTDFGHYVMNQLEKNMKPLKKRITSYDATVKGHMDKKIDLRTMRHKGLIRMAAGLAGWGKIAKLMFDYPDFYMAMEEDVHFNKGKITNSDLRISRLQPDISRRELKAVMHKDWFLDMNFYDKFYSEVKDKMKMLKGKKPEYELTYCGSYEENGHLIFILKFGHYQVEVVDECWQIRRMHYKASTRTINFEFQELSPNVYMPVAGRAEFNLDYEKYPKGTIGLSLGLQYRNIKK